MLFKTLKTLTNTLTLFVKAKTRSSDDSSPKLDKLLALTAQANTEAIAVLFNQEEFGGKPTKRMELLQSLQALYDQATNLSLNDEQEQLLEKINYTLQKAGIIAFYDRALMAGKIYDNSPKTRTDRQALEAACRHYLHVVDIITELRALRLYNSDMMPVQKKLDDLLLESSYNTAALYHQLYEEENIIDKKRAYLQKAIDYFTKALQHYQQADAAVNEIEQIEHQLTTLQRLAVMGDNNNHVRPIKKRHNAQDDSPPPSPAPATLSSKATNAPAEITAPSSRSAPSAVTKEINTMQNLSTSHPPENMAEPAEDEQHQQIMLERFGNLIEEPEIQQDNLAKSYLLSLLQQRWQFDYDFFDHLQSVSEIHVYSHLLERHFPRSMQFMFYCRKLIDAAQNIDNDLAATRSQILRQLWGEFFGFELDDGLHTRLFRNVESNRGAKYLRLQDEDLEPLNRYAPSYGILRDSVNTTNRLTTKRVRKTPSLYSIYSPSAPPAAEGAKRPNSLDDDVVSHEDIEHKATSHAHKSAKNKEKATKSEKRGVKRTYNLVQNELVLDPNNAIDMAIVAACKRYTGSKYTPSSKAAFQRTIPISYRSGKCYQEYAHIIFIKHDVQNERDILDALSQKFRFNHRQLLSIYYRRRVQGNNGITRFGWRSAIPGRHVSAKECELLPHAAQPGAVVIVRATAHYVDRHLKPLIADMEANQHQKANDAQAAYEASLKRKKTSEDEASQSAATAAPASSAPPIIQAGIEDVPVVRQDNQAEERVSEDNNFAKLMAQIGSIDEMVVDAETDALLKQVQDEARQAEALAAEEKALAEQEMKQQQEREKFQASLKAMIARQREQNQARARALAERKARTEAQERQQQKLSKFSDKFNQL